MNHSIWIREAASARDIDRFWAQLRAYFARDVFPDPESEERAYFLDGPEYPADIQRLHERAENRLRYLFLGACVVLILTLGAYAIPAIFVLYVVVSLVRWLLQGRRAAEA